MTVNERLAEAGLLAEFDKAAFAQNITALKRILQKVDLQEGTDQIIDWTFNSPHSPYNQHPIQLAPELKRDERVLRLQKKEQRIAQHLFVSHGGLDSKICSWQGCGAHALKDLAYCPYCAFAHAGIKT